MLFGPTPPLSIVSVNVNDRSRLTRNTESVLLPAFTARTKRRLGVSSTA